MSRNGFAMSTLRSNGDGRAKVVRGLTYGKANLDSSCVLVGASSWIYSRLSRAVKAARWPGCELPSQVCEAASLQRCRNRKAEDKAATCVKKEAPGSGGIPKLTVLITKASQDSKRLLAFTSSYASSVAQDNARLIRCAETILYKVCFWSEAISLTS